MRKTVKKLTAVGLTVTSVLGLVACGSSKGTTSQGTSENKEVTKPDTFTVMCDGTVVTETNGAEAFYKQLNEATGLDIKWTRPDHASYYDAVANAFNSDDTMPDVVLLSSDYYALYASNGFLWNMTDAWEHSETKNSGRLISTADNVLSALMVNGEDGTKAMYGLSLYRGNGCCTYVKKAWLDTLSDLNVCSQKGLVEMFDSSIGAASVYMPYGGKYQLTPTQSMVAKLPMSEGKCDTVTMMSYGLDPYLASWSPYHGSVYAVISSVAKIVAAGGDYSKIRFTFQEYFRRLGEDPKRWGEPMAALLGAYDAQIKLGLPSIGGKDSMSGTFNDIDVPPTLCSFAVDIAKTGDVVSPELKKAGNVLVKFDIEKDKYSLPVYDKLMSLYSKITDMIKSKVIVSAYAVGFGGICEAVSKMAFGNGLGVKIDESVDRDELFAKEYGSIIAEVSADDLDKIMAEYKKIALVTDDAEFVYGDAVISMKEALENWTGKLESVFPTRSDVEQIELEDKLFDAKTVYTAKNKVARPKVFIPVFPGTNCEYDTTKAFELAGADVKTVVFKNMTESQIVESVNAFEAAIKESQILMFSGGFSAGDEPDGSAKFIASIFRNPKIMEAVHELLQKRDGLALGICNGFQALIKLGLVPFGEIKPQTENAPTLTTNSIGRHISKSVYTKVVTNKSPWLMKAELGGVYAIPASHGEGRFVAPKNVIDNLFANGQVATRYVDLNGVPTMDEDYNPNGSYAAIEGITSPDGRVLGKMAHSERIGDSVAINIVGNQNQHIFESGVSYFK